MPKLSEPFFSVIVPTFNRPDMLRRALRSLKWQTYRNFEVLVVNDQGESPKSVVDEFSALDVTLLTSTVKGVSGARNAGLEAARGRYIAYLDDDDLLYENHLEISANCHDRFGDYVYYSKSLENLQTQDEHGEWCTVLRRSMYDDVFRPDSFFTRNITPVLCVTHPKTCMQIVPGFSTLLRSHEDWCLWQTLARFHPFVFVDNFTCDVMNRVAPGSSLSKNIPVMRETWIHVRALGECLAHMAEAQSLQDRARSCRVTLRAAAGGYLTVLLRITSLAELHMAVHRCLPVLSVGQNIAILLDGCAELESEATRLLRPFVDERRVTLASTPEYTGTVYGFNQLLSYCSTPFIAFVSPYVRLRAESWQQLCDSAVREQCFMGAGLRHGDTVYAGGSISEYGEASFHVRQDAPTDGTRVDCLPLELLLAPLAVLRTLGGVPVVYAPGSYEDVDMCIRAKKQCGVGSMLCGVSFDVPEGFRTVNSTHTMLYGAEMFSLYHGAVLRPWERLRTECWSSVNGREGPDITATPWPQGYHESME